MNSNDEDQIYRKLQKHLDSLPVDYPETESGVEIRILKHLFTPQEAEIALKLKLIPQEAKVLYRPFKKKGWTLEQFTEYLLGMGKKGAIMWIENEEGINYFGVAPLAAGFYDFQIDRLTKEFAEDFEQYCDEGFISAMLENGILQMRTVPVEKSVPVEYAISNFDEIKEIINRNNRVINLSPCICRQAKEIQGMGCEHPIETCMSIGPNPRFPLQVGRVITNEEALDVLQKSQEMGMVICPSNSQWPFLICSCCGCSCMFLENLKKYENPARFVNSNYFITTNKDLCTGCGECVSSCHMDAISLNENGLSETDLGYCIGCGLCVPKCPENARKLKRKEKGEIPPKNFTELYQNIAKRKAELKEIRKTDKEYGKVRRVKY
ncbi:MAG: ATP-binding protein [Promethearchaeota archaeon]